MKVISCASLKGGVGKTSLSVFLALALAKRGRKVLVVDMDPNNSATDFFLRETDPQAIEATNVFHVLTGGAPPSQAVLPSPLGVDVIPSTLNLHQVEAVFVRDPRAFTRFGRRLTSLPYDFAILDTPPFLGVQLRAALYASDLVLTPTAPSRWILWGFNLLSAELEQLEEDRGTPLPRRIVSYMTTANDALKMSFFRPELLMGHAVPKSAAVKKATDTGHALKGGGPAVQAFDALAADVDAGQLFMGQA